MSGKFERKKQKKATTWKKPVLIVLTVILLLFVALVIAAIVYYNAMLGKIKQVDVPKINYTTAATEYIPETRPVETEEATEASTEQVTEAPTEPHVASSEDYINFLLIGQDAREGEQNNLADTMILCTVNTYEKTLALTSIQRDTQLQVSGSYRDNSGKNHTYGGVKINMMYASGYQWGGTGDAMGVMNQVLYDNFGIEVDYDIEVNFDAFVRAIDAIGGITLDLTEAEADYLNDDGKVWQTVSAGENLCDGYTSLAYARMRKAAGDGESDIKRTVRQRNVISAVLNQLKTMNLTQVQNMINEILPNISTSMDNSEITAMIAKLLPMLPDIQITSSGSCPHDSWGDTVDIFGNGVYHSVLKFNPQSERKYMRALTLGEGTIE